MAPDPPSFGSAKYWNERFLREPETFEWLREPEIFQAAIAAALKDTSSTKPQILHIGCGTSELPFYLRTLVSDPAQIHNTDFSRVAINLGKEEERGLLDLALENRADDEVKSKSPMRWSRLDLLSFDDVRNLLSAQGGAPYSIILDKSTSDAIACGADVRVPLPHDLRAEESPALVYPGDGNVSPSTPSRDSLVAHIHPIHALALHLAYLTAPGSRWIALSYSQQRFPFLPPYPSRSEDGRLSRWIVEAGLVHPQRLWRLLSREDLPPSSPPGEQPDDGSKAPVPQPVVVHTLYILERTAVPLHIRPLL